MKNKFVTGVMILALVQALVVDKAEGGMGDGATAVANGANIGNAVNTAANGALTAQAYTPLCGPHGCIWPWLFLLAPALLAALQGGADSGASGQAGATFAAVDNSNFHLPNGGDAAGDNRLNPNGPGNDGGNGFDINKFVAGLDPETRKNYDLAVEKGFKINPDGVSVTTPDGKVVKGSDYASKQAMAGIGLSPSQIEMASNMFDKINKEAAAKMGPSVVAMGVDAGGGGGGGRSPASFDDGGNASADFDAYLKKLRNPFGLSADQKKKLVAGKTLRNGEDFIGVGVDDIFQMIHRRYQEKRASDEFIEPGKTSPVAGAKAATLITPKVPPPRR